MTQVITKVYLMKVATIANPKAFKEPFVLRYFTKTSFAISMKDALEDILAVFPIILKKTISKGVITRVITEDETNEAIKIFMKTSRLAPLSDPCLSI